MSDFDPSVLGGSVKRRIVNPDLLEERAKCNFNQRELCLFLFGQSLVDYIEGVSDFLNENPQICSSVDYYEKSREEQLREWWERIDFVLRHEKMKHHFTSNSTNVNNNFHWAYLLPGQNPIVLHVTMFTESILLFGSEA